VDCIVIHCSAATVNNFNVNCIVWWGTCEVAASRPQMSGWRRTPRGCGHLGHTRWPRPKLQPPDARSAQPWMFGLSTWVLSRPSACAGQTSTHMWRLGCIKTQLSLGFACCGTQNSLGSLVVQDPKLTWVLPVQDLNSLGPTNIRIDLFYENKKVSPRRSAGHLTSLN